MAYEKIEKTLHGKRKKCLRLTYNMGVGREKLRCEKAHFENQAITTRTIHTQLLQIQMADRLGRTAQNLQIAQKAPLRRADRESDCAPSGQEHHRGGPAHKPPPSTSPVER